MKSCQFDDRELDVLNHAVNLLKKDFEFDLVTAAKNKNLEWSQQLIDGLSTLEFILFKIKIEN